MKTQHVDMLFIHPPATVNGAAHTLDADVGFTEQFVSLPIGFYSMADNLEKAGYRAAILNLGERVWQQRDMQMQALLGAELERFQPRVVGIDIHWMIHSAGGVETARLVKSLRPATTVVAGGITASFFADELLGAYPQFDFVMVGECDTAIVELLRALEHKRVSLRTVPNLVYRQSRSIRHNTVVPPDIRSTLELTRYDLLAHPPAINPDRAILSFFRGCMRNCCHCAGARESFGVVMRRPEACILDAEHVVTLINRNLERGRDKIYLYGDIRLGGRAYVDAFFRALNASGAHGAHIVFELFRLADAAYIQRWTDWAGRTGNTLEATHSPESGHTSLRRRFGKYYTNAQLLDHCRLMADSGIPQSVYFMLGIPGQTRREVLDTLELADAIAGIYSRRFRKEHLRHDVVSYNFVQVPDAGSRMFRQPDRHGVQLEIRTFTGLVDRLRSARHWSQIQGYSLHTLDKREMAELYYNIQETMPRIYRRHGLITATEMRRRLAQIAADRREAIRLEMISPISGQ